MLFLILLLFVPMTFIMIESAEVMLFVDFYFYYYHHRRCYHYYHYCYCYSWAINHKLD